MATMGHPSCAPIRLLSAIALVLGHLCAHGLAQRTQAVSKFSSVDIWPGEQLLSRWREKFSARVDADGRPATSLFEQAFTSAFGSKGPDQVSRTLAQYDQLANWVEHTKQLNATQAAFLPELGDDKAAMDLFRAALKLARDNMTEDAALVAALRGLAAQLHAAAASTPWRGFAATRRALLGAILSQRIRRASRFPPVVATAVDDLLLQLFAAHRVSAAARGAVQFFHISKSGGTNLCQAAGANGCASQGFDTRTNCLIRDFLDQPRWVSYNGHKFLQTRLSSRQGLPWFVNFHTFRPPYTCAQRRAYLLREGFTFYANEYTNPPPGLDPDLPTLTPTASTTTSNTAPAGAFTSSSGTAPTATTSTTTALAAAVPGAGAGTPPSSLMCERDFVNLIMLRHPHDRLRSQIAWIQKLYKEYYLDVDTQPAFLNRTSGFWERLMPAAVDNYYTRSLLGQRFFEFPVLAVGPQHAELAKLAALQHDILLMLDDKAANEAALRCGLGWTAAGLREAAVRSSNELGDEVALPGDYSALLARNALDVELYGFAREMAMLDALLWNFVAAADAAAGGALVGGDGVGEGEGGVQGNGNGAAQCGYVSAGGPAAAAALAERLREVDVPPKMGVSSPSGVGVGDAASGANTAPVVAAVAAAAAGDADAGASAVGGVGGSGRSRAGFMPLGDATPRAAGAAGGGGGGGRGPAVVSINRRNGRRLLRLKTTLHGQTRHRRQERSRAAT